MARIRTIKPEFWGSPSHRYADPWVRLFYVAMWNWADDTGRGTANPRELAAFAFPDDEDPTVPTVDDVPRLLLEVQQRYDAVFYKVDGRRYYSVPKWDKHQRNERRAASRHPGPADGSPYDPGPGDGISYSESRNFRDAWSEAPRGRPARASGRSADASSQQALPVWDDSDRDDEPTTSQQDADQPKDQSEQANHGSSVTTDGSSSAGTGEQGNRGTKLSCVAAATTDADGPPATPSPSFDDFWAVYPRKVAKKEARKRFDAAIRDGADPATIVATATAHVTQWRRESKQVQFIPHASTWLNQGRFEDPVERSFTVLAGGSVSPWRVDERPVSPWAQDMGWAR